jgi:hypothetical protein
MPLRLGNKLWLREDEDVRSELRSRYLRTLGLDWSDATTKPRLEAALTRAYALAISRLSIAGTRGAYFWAFQVAIFAALA